MRLQHGLMKSLAGFGAIGALALAAASCSEAEASQNVGVSQQALNFDDIAAQCGLACPGGTDDKGVTIKGIADGNAAISGVASVDSFFASVINFQGAATGVAGGIDAQLAAIRGDFGIAASDDLAAKLQAQITANVDGEIKLDAEPAKCQADVQATLDATARCDAEFKKGSVMVECKGGCDVEPGMVMASCSADAELECTFTPPDLKCSGSCQGTCAADFKVAASCSGTCKGTCSGNCSAYVKNTSGAAECSGSCDGTCKGSCETEFAASATCSGECKGQCTVTNPKGGCTAGASAQCKATAKAPSVMCDGKCDGEVTPPMAKAECQASVKADAKVNVQCTPPRVALTYKLKVVTGAQLDAQVKFEAALKTLGSVRLPALLAEIKRGSSVVDAGASLVTSSTDLVKAFGDAATSTSLSVKAKFGLVCAGNELPNVPAVVTKASASLNTSITAAGKLTAVFKS